MTLITFYRKGEKVRSGIGTIKIGRKWWNILITEFPLVGVYGYCNESLRTIVVDGTIKDNPFLDTLIHEVRHAVDPKATEAAVERQGTVTANLLTAFGCKL